MSRSAASTDVSEPPPRPEPLLRPHVSEKFALSWQHVLVTGFFALLFAVLNHLPLYHSDIWGHVQYGHWILEHGKLPLEDPFVSLAAGVRVVDYAWLSQVIFAATDDFGGAEWLSNTFAIVVTATYVVLAVAFYFQTRRAGMATVGAILVLLLGSTRLLVIRPEIFGTLCFAVVILLAVLAGRRAWLKERPGSNSPGHSELPSGGRVWAAYVGIPVTFALWANLHGAFPVGLAFLGCHFLGRALEAAWGTKSLRGVLQDRELRRWLYLTELAAAAVLLNPHTIDAYINSFTFARNPNLRDVLEWQELHSRAYEAMWLAVSWVMLLFVLRHSRVVVRPVHVLLLGVFSVGVWFNVRISLWYAFVFGYVIVPHLAELLGRKWPRRVAPAQRVDGDEATTIRKSVFGRTYIHTLVCALLVWCGFAFSPIARPVLGGKPRAPDQLYLEQTPLAVTEFLRAHPPAGRVYNPQWWGDWMLRSGPPGLQIFMNTTAVHLAPAQVWRDYMLISRAGPGWERALEKYRVDTVVVSKSEEPRLALQARQLVGWRIVYEDDQALVVSRDPALRGRADSPKDAVRSRTDFQGRRKSQDK